MQEVTTALEKTRAASRVLAALPPDHTAEALNALADNIDAAAVEILAANALDLAAMPKDDPRYDRLLLDEKRLAAIADDVRKVAAFPAPAGIALEQKTLPNGLHLEKRSVPLGVVGVIYESRPNVTVDVFALCFRAGNAVALKGGKEADHSNRAFVKVIHETLASFGLPAETVYLLPPQREATTTLLQAVGLVDICIPRGSQALIDHVRDNAHIPVIETGAGIVHTYVDESADMDKAQKIILNAKTRRVSVCNALDTLVIHRARLSGLAALCAPLAAHQVEIFADPYARKALSGHYPEALLKAAREEDFGREFLSHKMSIRTVDNLAEALAHIAQYSSRHSEAIVAEDAATIDAFLNSVDAAAVYANASTAFTDGGQFGMGAEIGISTQKLHARGPMGLQALTSYKWVVRGDGHVRG
jgi:glutamate-5-semialdehyde dehydrogenase